MCGTYSATPWGHHAQLEAARRQYAAVCITYLTDAPQPSRVPRVVRCKGCGDSHGQDLCPYCERPAP